MRLNQVVQLKHSAEYSEFMELTNLLNNTIRKNIENTLRLDRSSSQNLENLSQFKFHHTMDLEMKLTL